LKKRLLTYLGSACYFIPFWELKNLGQGHSTGYDSYLIYGIIAIAICVTLPWHIIGFWVPFVYLSYFF
jgi:hypothetical protein